MKTSMCLLSMVLLSFGANAYDYTLKSIAYEVKLTYPTGGIRYLAKGSTLETEDVPYRVDVYATTESVDFKHIEGKNDLFDAQSNEELKLTGTIFNPDNKISWGVNGYPLNSGNMNGEWVYGNPVQGMMRCPAPKTITMDRLFKDVRFRPVITGSIRLVDPFTGHTWTVDLWCLGEYELSSSVAVFLQNNVVKLTGPAGKTIRSTESINVRADAGTVVRLSIVNPNRNDVSVSFSNNEEILDDQIQFQSTNGDGAADRQLYITTLSTDPGERQYNVKIEATFI
ncbi:TPA: hypothetical protein JS362_004706 [Escherichia coli]|nr:hypothetical protein [Escherichia coli]